MIQPINQIDSLVRDIAAGEPYKELAPRYGTNRWVISHVRRLAGLPRRRRNQRVSDVEIAHQIGLGKSGKEIALHLRIAESAVSNARKRLGFPKAKTGPGRVK